VIPAVGNRIAPGDPRAMQAIQLSTVGLAVPSTADLTFLDQPFLPTVRQYVPVVRSQAEGPNGGAGGSLLQPPPTTSPTFYNVTVWAKEFVRAPGVAAPSQAEIAGGLGSQSSYYKIRIRWSQFPSRDREILIDAGTAFDISAGPTTSVQVDLMAPDPTSSDPTPPEFAGYRVDAYIVASIWPNAAPIGHATGRFTQALYVPLPGTPPLPRPCIRIADGARTLQILGDLSGEPSSVFWSIVDTDGSALRPLGNVSVLTGPGETGTDIVEIPQYAKAACFNLAGDMMFTAVQGLEL